MADPSEFQPSVIDLSASAVQVVRTSLSNPRVVFDKNGLRAYDASGNLLVNLDAAAGSAFFAGIVQALGLTIPVASNPGPSGPPASKIEWTTGGGGVVADIFGWQGADGAFNSNELVLEAAQPDGVNQTRSKINLNAPGVDVGASLLVIGGKSTDPNGIWMSIGAATVNALNSAGHSDFLQAAKNLSDLVNLVTARANLGLGSAATAALASLLQVANNLSDVANLAATRANLGILTFNPTLVFTASAKATEVNIVHNLGRLPGHVSITPVGDPAVIIAPYYKNLGSNTTITIGGYTTAAITKNVTVTVEVSG